MPSYPWKHSHTPVALSHNPLLEHSTQGCRLFAPTVAPTQAKSLGQVRREQSGPVHSGTPSMPLKHKQLLFLAQVPCPEQKLSQSPVLRDLL